MRFPVALLALFACVTSVHAERSADSENYENMADTLLRQIADSASLPGTVIGVERRRAPHAFYLLRHRQYIDIMRSMAHDSGLPEAFPYAPLHIGIFILVDGQAYRARIVNGFRWMPAQEVPPLAFEELLEKLDRYGYGGREAKKSNFRKMQDQGNSHKDNCSPSDLACQALQLALAQERPVTLPTAPEGEQQEGAQCSSYLEPAYSDVTYSCLDRVVLDGRMVANSAAVSSSHVNAPFVHLGGYEGEGHRANQLFSSYRLVLPDLDGYKSVQLVLQSASNVLSFAVNEVDVPLASVPQKPICYGQGRLECALEVGSLRDGVELGGLLNDGVNHLALVQQGPRAGTDGILLRLVRADATPLGSLSGCQAKLAPNCAFTEAARCQESVNGVCLRMERSYSCRTFQVGRQDGGCAQRECQGPNCPSGRLEVDNDDVREVLAKLESIRQMAVYMTNDSYEVFAGVEGTCRSDVSWGLGSCCKASGDRTSTTNAVALAQLGVGHVIRGVSTLGSPHTYDILFQADDIVDYLGNLGQSVLGSALSPSLSYYGLQVSATKGALAFSFDPASFAVAVGLAVIANLLECGQHEKVLGVKLGAGLCYETRRWCSKRRFFFCKERSKSFCCFNSRLAKQVNQQGLAQLRGRRDLRGCANGGCSQNPYTNKPAAGGGNCRGLSHDELRALDFSKIDLSSLIAEFTPELDAGIYGRYLQDNLDAVDAAVESTSALVPQPGE